MTRFLRRRAAACLAAGLLLSLTPHRGAAAGDTATPAPSPTSSPTSSPTDPADPTTGPSPDPSGSPPGSPGDALDPLQVTIDRITPSTILRRTRLTVAGTVTNVSDSVWTELDAYLLTSTSPMTTSAQLADALELDPRTSVGDRLTDAGQFVELPDLAPGETTRYRIRIPTGELAITGEPGVYWVGVQVLGSDETGRIDGADGRARTFVPLMRQNDPPRTSLALMIPFRARILYDEDGRPLTQRAWYRALSGRGRFGRLLAFSQSAGTFPVSWVVDAALVDLARSLAADSPGLRLGPPGDAPTVTGTPSETASGGTDPSGTASESPPGSPTDGPEPAKEVSPEAQQVRAWLDGFLAEAARRDVLALPYGDVDVTAAHTWSDGSTVEGAFALAQATLAAAEIATSPVIDPPDGSTTWSTLESLDGSVPVVLDDTEVLQPGPRVDVPRRARLTLTHSASVAGMPNAAHPREAFSVRQRVLAEAAVHALGPDRDQPLVVELPDRWDPRQGWARAQFFAGLDVPWLTGAVASSLMSASTTTTMERESEALYEPSIDDQMPAGNFSAARDLLETGRTLDVLLPRNDRIGSVVAGFAYLGTSGQLREAPRRAENRTEDLDDALTDLMEKVTVTGPSFVTMSSEEGQFQVTIANGLDEPVSVGVEARTVAADEITIPATQPVTIPPGERRSVRMTASSSRVGVWPVLLQPVNAEGEPLGDPDELSIRSSHVGQFVWGVLGAGTLLLVVLILFRIRRRVRARQATHGPVLNQATP